MNTTLIYLQELTKDKEINSSVSLFKISYHLVGG